MNKLTITIFVAMIGSLPNIATANPSTFLFQRSLQSLSVNVNCKTPWGTDVLDKTSVLAYANSSAPAGQCQSESRLCSGGVLSGRFTNSSCIELGAASCDTPWGGSLLSGQSVLAYQTGVVPYGSTCVSESRTCANGILSGAFTYQACTVAPAAACNTPWNATIASGSAILAYQTNIVPYGSTCTSENRTCNNGTLSGSFTNELCTVAQPTSCTLSDGVVVAHGYSAQGFTTNSVSATDSCSNYKTTITCNNGVATPTPSYTGCINDTVQAASHINHFDNSTTPSVGTMYSKLVGGTLVSDASVGGGALYFSGLNRSTGLSIPKTATDVQFGTGDFTVQFWYKPIVPHAASAIFGTGNYSVESGIFVRAYGDATNTTMAMGISNAGSTLINYYGSVTVATGVWHHFALVRKSGTVILYIDGAQVASKTFSGTLNQGIDIGNADNSTSVEDLSTSYGFAVNIDELVISKSALYSGPFTPAHISYKAP